MRRGWNCAALERNDCGVRFGAVGIERRAHALGGVSALWGPGSGACCRHLGEKTCARAI